MKVQVIEEGLFNNPEQARAKREREASKSSAEVLAKTANDLHIKKLKEVFEMFLKEWGAGRWGSDDLCDSALIANGAMAIIYGFTIPDIVAYLFNTSYTLGQKKIIQNGIKLIYDLHPETRTIDMNIYLGTGVLIPHFSYIMLKGEDIGKKILAGNTIYRAQAPWKEVQWHTPDDMKTNGIKCWERNANVMWHYLVGSASQEASALSDHFKASGVKEFMEILDTYRLNINPLHILKGKHLDTVYLTFEDDSWNRGYWKNRFEGNNGDKEKVINFINAMFSFEHTGNEVIGTYYTGRESEGWTEVKFIQNGLAQHNTSEAIDESYFKNPEEAKAAKERNANKGNAEKLASTARAEEKRIVTEAFYDLLQIFVTQTHQESDGWNDADRDDMIEEFVFGNVIKDILGIRTSEQPSYIGFNASFHFETDVDIDKKEIIIHPYLVGGESLYDKEKKFSFNAGIVIMDFDYEEIIHRYAYSEHVNNWNLLQDCADEATGILASYGECEHSLKYLCGYKVVLDKIHVLSGKRLHIFVKFLNIDDYNSDVYTWARSYSDGIAGVERAINELKSFLNNTFAFENDGNVSLDTTNIYEKGMPEKYKYGVPVKIQGK